MGAGGDVMTPAFDCLVAVPGYVEAYRCTGHPVIGSIAGVPLVTCPWAPADQVFLMPTGHVEGEAWVQQGRI